MTIYTKITSDSTVLLLSIYLIYAYYMFRKMSSRSVLLPQGNTARPVMRAIKIPADRTMEWAQDYRMGTGVP